MRLRDVEQTCADRLHELDLPPGASLAALIDLLSRRRGRSLEVVDTKSPTGLCGAWVSMTQRDVVFVDAAASGVRRTHILLHELAHVALDHDLEGDVLPLATMARLFPDIDPATVRAVLGRDRYSTDEEKQAEVLAWLLSRELKASQTGADGSVDNLLSAAFDSRVQLDA